MLLIGARVLKYARIPKIGLRIRVCSSGAYSRINTHPKIDPEFAGRMPTSLDVDIQGDLVSIISDLAPDADAAGKAPVVPLHCHATERAAMQVR